MMEIGQSIQNSIAQLVESLLIEQYGNIYEEAILPNGTIDSRVKGKYCLEYELTYNEIIQLISKFVKQE